MLIPVRASGVHPPLANSIMGAILSTDPSRLQFEIYLNIADHALRHAPLAIEACRDYIIVMCSHAHFSPTLLIIRGSHLSRDVALSQGEGIK